MQIRQNRRLGTRFARISACGTALFAAVIALSGCASPGPPLPPTLNLPQVVSGTGLTATRVGDEVRLYWTTPARTTDKLPIKGPMVAEICRSATAATQAKSACTAVTRVPVTAGASDAVDRLPAELTAGPARMISYRVQLMNAAGRTAGPSPVVNAAAGDVPRPVEGFAVSATKAGALLRWRVEADGRAGTVELDRTVLDPAETEKKSRVPGGQKQTAETRFRAGEGGGDAGGTVDRTVEIGHTYSYAAQRVETVMVGGQALELRSVPTVAISVAVRDDFPPDVPAGLVAVPGTGGGVEGETQRPAIDLSWEPDVEARVAGYRVYRRDMGDGSGAWARIGSEMVTMAAYRDLTVVAGQRYAYRVTAVSTSGNESAPSGEAVETAR